MAAAVAALLYMYMYLSIGVSVESLSDDGAPSSSSSLPLMGGVLIANLCRDRLCSDDCKTYQTQLNKCYNGQILFPGDPSWGNFDVLDSIHYRYRYHQDDESDGYTENDYGEDLPVHASTLQRIFFKSTNSTCRLKTDSFDSIPLNECVGPFGDPRPWGKFFIERDRNAMKR